MEASLGTRESEYAHSREAVVFMVGSIFWILSIIIGSGQISRPEWAHQACSDAACAIQKSFWLIVSNVAANPWLWLIGAAVSALTALIMVRRAFARLRSSRALRSGFSRALDALMASMIRVVRRPVAAWLLTIVAGCGIIFLTAWLGTKFLMHALSVVTPLIAVR